MTARRFGQAAFSVVLFASAAMAGGTEPDPNLATADWDVVRQTDAASTSRCIGKPETPLCAVETLLACFVRSEKALCDVIGKDMPSFYFDSKSPWSSERYKVLETRTLRDEDIPNYKREGPWAWKPGDVQIVLRRVSCHDEDCWPDVNPPMTVTLRFDGYYWKYADMHAPRVQ